MVKKLLLFFGIVLSCQLNAQNYFVDGYHGGLYGHYPLDTYTQYILEQIHEHPDWYVCLEIEPETWDSVRVRTPQAYSEFQQVAVGRQVEFTNPTYAQPYMYCISGESILRQFQYGIRKLRQHFPDARIETYACEEPCYTSCLPTILPFFGFRYITLKCPDTCWGGYANNFGGQFVRLVGPDGSSMPCVPRYECEELQPNSVWQTIAWNNQESYWKACQEAGIKQPIGMCYQDAGWRKGPWIGYGDTIKHGTEYILWSDYFERFLPERVLLEHRFSQEDICPGLMWGSQVLQQIAQRCRSAENALIQSEKILAIARLSNGYHWDQTVLDEAWRKLMLSQHHDCWIVPYNDGMAVLKGTWAQNVNRWTQSCIQTAQFLSEDALSSISPSGQQSLLIINTTSNRLHTIVPVGQGRGHIEVDLPAFGYRIIPLTKISPVKKSHDIRIKGDELLVETDCLSLRFDLQHGGVIRSLVNRQSGVEHVDSTSTFAFGEIRGWWADKERFHSTADASATIEIHTDNRLVKEFTITTSVAGIPVRTSYTLRKGSPVIDCHTDILWTRNQHIGKLYDTRFALSLILPTQQGTLSKNAPFDVCESRFSDTFFDDWHQLKHNLILDWIDVRSSSASLALFSDHTTSYSYGQDFPLALTLQYSGKGLWGRDYRIVEPTRVHYAIVPHQGHWDQANIPAIYEQWKEPPIIRRVSTSAPQQCSFLDLTGTGRQLTSVTLNDTALQARIFNATTSLSRFQISTQTLRK